MAWLIISWPLGKRSLPFLIILLIVVFRIASGMDVPGSNIAYVASVSFLFALAGAKIILNKPCILSFQLKIFIIVSVPLMLLQLAGVSDWLQVFNSLYASADVFGNIEYLEVKLIPLAFSSEIFIKDNFYELYQGLSMQVRPPGLTHSSAMNSIFILAGSALYFGMENGSKSNKFDPILVSAIVLTGSKLAVLGFLIIVILFYFFSYSIQMRMRFLKIFGLIIFIFALYVAVFPVAYIHNFDVGSFEVSFLGRIGDAITAVAPSFVDSALLSATMEFYYSTVDKSVVPGTLSGMAAFIRVLPYIVMFVFFLAPWLFSLFSRFKKIYPEIARTSLITFLVVLLTPLATPIAGSQFYALIVGIALAPFIFKIKLMRHHHALKNNIFLSDHMVKF